MVFSVCAITTLGIISILGKGSLLFQEIQTILGEKFLFQWATWPILIWSVVADYFNLLKTRVVINILIRRDIRDPITLLSFAFLDFFFGFCAFVFGVRLASVAGELGGSAYYFSHCPKCASHVFALLGYLWSAILEHLGESYIGMFSYLLNVMLHEGLLGFYSILFLAGLVPSIWLWLYTVSSLVTWIVEKSHLGIRFLVDYFLDIDGHPFQSIGYVAAAMATIGYALGAVVWRLAEAF